MSSQIPSLDATALTLMLFLAIHLYVRLTLVWVASLSNRYAEHIARQARVRSTEDSIASDRPRDERSALEASSTPYIDQQP